MGLKNLGRVFWAVLLSILILLFFVLGAFHNKTNAGYRKADARFNKEQKQKSRIEILKQSKSWRYKLQDRLTSKDISAKYDIYDIDLFENSKEDILALKKQNAFVICYFSAGTYEPYRSDSAKFSESVIGNVYGDWPEERWLNITAPEVFNIMTDRIELASLKGCDAVEFDNTDIYLHDSGFSISVDDAVAYFKRLSEYARNLGILPVLKNSLEFASQLDTQEVQLMVTEQCYENHECIKYRNSFPHAKILDVEYLDSWDLNAAQALCAKLCSKYECGAQILFAVSTYDLNTDWLSCVNRTEDQK